MHSYDDDRRCLRCRAQHCIVSSSHLSILVTNFGFQEWTSYILKSHLLMCMCSSARNVFSKNATSMRQLIMLEQEVLSDTNHLPHNVWKDAVISTIVPDTSLLLVIFATVSTHSCSTPIMLRITQLENSITVWIVVTLSYDKQKGRRLYLWLDRLLERVRRL